MTDNKVPGSFHPVVNPNAKAGENIYAFDTLEDIAKVLQPEIFTKSSDEEISK